MNNTSYWDGDDNYPVEDWRYEVANDDTRQGYADWVAEKKLEAEEERHAEIFQIAREQYCKGGDEDPELDPDSRISEGDSNGCYVQFWLWVTFSGTELDKTEEL